MSQVVHGIEQVLRKWRWNHIVPPIYAIYMVTIGVGLIVWPNRYDHVASWMEMAELLPYWMWGVLFIGIGIAVLIKDTPMIIMIQAALMLFEGFFTLLIGLHNQEVSPTIGFRALFLGLAFWLLALKDLTDHEIKYKTKE